VLGRRWNWSPPTGVVIASPSTYAYAAADIYWFTKKRIVWEYVSYLDVLVK